MQIEKTFIEGLLIIHPKVYEDQRGYFMESYKHEKWDKFLHTTFVQDNESMSKKRTLRGLHFQKPPYAQAKLIRVIKGSVLDVAVDLRKSSPTYGKYYKMILSAENKKQFFIPKGFAHGFLSLEDDTILSYKCSDYYHATSEGTLQWNDTDLAIDWDVLDPILSDKDKLAEKFTNFSTPFE